MKPIIAVKDKQGKVYTMPSETTTCILEVHYTTSYYQFEVQDTVEEDYGALYFPKKTIVVPIDESNWIDFIAVSKDEIGELVKVESL